MPDTVLSNLDILRKEFFAEDVAKILNETLLFPPGSLPSFAADAPSIRYYEDLYSDSSDPLKLDPILLGSSAEFPTVKVSSISEKFAGLLKYGLAIQFDEDVRRYADRLDEIVRTRDRVGYWLAAFRNKIATDAIVKRTWGAANDPTDAVTGPRVLEIGTAWTASGANPVSDVIDAIKRIEDQTGYAYTLTDLWMKPTTYFAFVKYVVDNDAAVWQGSPFGPLTVPAIGGVNFHKVLAAPSDTFVSTNGEVALGMDMRAGKQAVTRYFSQNQGDVPESGGYTQAGDGLFVHSFFNDLNHKLTYQFWFEEVYVNREPRGVILLDGTT
jgi:hypothetical protein